MKKPIRALMFTLLVGALGAEGAKAQGGYRMESLLVSSGSDPITHGVAGIARFTKESGRFVEVSAQSEQAWLAYGQPFRKGALNFVAAGALVHFQKAVGVGLRLDASVRLGELVHLDVLYWPGIFVEEPDDWKTENDGVENPESTYHGHFGGVRLWVGPLVLSYYMLNFLDEPWNELPAVSYTWAFREDFSASLSATWNNNDEDWLPWIGATWTP